MREEIGGVSLMENQNKDKITIGGDLW